MGAELEETGWTCDACGNLNFADREICNMRKCRLPRDGQAGILEAEAPIDDETKKQADTNPDMWECRHCGNNNFMDRMICNMRKCRRPREDSEVPANAPRREKGEPSRSRGNTMWTCECGNKNYEDKQVCNLRKCRLPKPMNKPSRPWMDRSRKRPPPRSEEFNAGSHTEPRALDAREGSWICECGNKNFPDKEFCNLRKCGLPKPVQVRPPRRNFEAFPGRHRGRQAADGWTCQCGNVNYSDRLVCNLRSCKLPRPDEAPAKRRRKEPKEMWKCNVCENLNYMDREKCNSRKCGLAREGNEEVVVA